MIAIGSTCLECLFKMADVILRIWLSLGEFITRSALFSGEQPVRINGAINIRCSHKKGSPDNTHDIHDISMPTYRGYLFKRALSAMRKHGG